MMADSRVNWFRPSTCWDFMPFSVRDDALRSRANLRQTAVEKVRQNRQSHLPYLTGEGFLWLAGRLGRNLKHPESVLRIGFKSVSYSAQVALPC